MRAKYNDRRSFDLIEKVMDERLEDELVLGFHPFPILHGFKKDRTPARIMSLLCDIPTGPHSAEKERLLCALAASVDFHPDDTRRHHYVKEAVVFMIKHTRPGDCCVGSGANEVRMRVCPGCCHAPISETCSMLVAIHFIWQVQKDRTCRGRSICGSPKYEHCANHGSGQQQLYQQPEPRKMSNWKP